MKNKHVGFLIIGITFLFLLLIFSFNNALETIVNETCTHGVTCPMQVTLKTQKLISYGLVGLLFLVGGFVSFFMKDEKIYLKKEVDDKVGSVILALNQEERNKKLEHLDDEEKLVMNLLIRENGSTYQSDLIKESDLTKVRMSRLLDKLEGRGLIERKRRGMTNIVILK